jgi:hypothetical protein
MAGANLYLGLVVLGSSRKRPIQTQFNTAKKTVMIKKVPVHFAPSEPANACRVRIAPPSAVAVSSFLFNRWFLTSGTHEPDTASSGRKLCLQTTITLTNEQGRRPTV